MKLNKPSLQKSNNSRRRAADARAGRTSRRGNSTLEMALVLPMLLAVVFGMIEFGQYYFIKNAFESATRDAARAGSLAIAAQADPAASATKTLGFSNVTFNSSWMTIRDEATNSTVTDVSTVAPGHAMSFTIQQTYSALPVALRPLFSLTGIGIGNAKVVSGKCTVIKE